MTGFWESIRPVGREEMPGGRGDGPIMDTPESVLDAFRVFYAAVSCAMVTEGIDTEETMKPCLRCENDKPSEIGALVSAGKGVYQFIRVAYVARPAEDDEALCDRFEEQRLAIIEDAHEIIGNDALRPAILTMDGIPPYDSDIEAIQAAIMATTAAIRMAPVAYQAAMNEEEVPDFPYTTCVGIGEGNVWYLTGKSGGEAAIIGIMCQVSDNHRSIAELTANYVMEAYGGEDDDGLDKEAEIERIINDINFE